jgi:amino acid adenylation domain-containing protein
MSTEKTAPMSFAQQRLWFLNEVEPSGGAYNIPVALKLRGDLSISALRQALNFVVQRHEILRTTFRSISGNAVQIVSPDLEVARPVVDLCALSQAGKESTIRRFAEEETQRDFDLRRGPMMRAVLLRGSETDHVLLLTVHHIVADGWSMGILVDEMAASYLAFTDGQTPILPQLPMQFADFAKWERQNLNGERLKSKLTYWRERLAEPLPTLRLATDHPHPLEPTVAGGTYGVAIPAEVTARLRLLSRSCNATLFMTLLSAFQVLLRRCCGQTDIVVGSSIANRAMSQAETLIGFFVNMIVFRSDLSGNPKFIDLLAQVREMTLGAYAHQDVPFEYLVENLRPQRDPVRSPFFQVVFAFQNMPRGTAQLPGITIEPLALGHHTAKYDLTLSINESAAGLQAAFEYRRALFEEETIVRLGRHFQILLEAFAQDPEQRVDEVNMLPEEELQVVLYDWNATAADYRNLSGVHELIRQRAAENRERAAIITAGSTITYGELEGRANQLAHCLSERGLKAEQTIGVCLRRSPELIVALLAIWKAGNAYLLLDPQHPAELLNHALRDSGTALVVTESSLRQYLPACPHILMLDKLQREMAMQPATPPGFGIHPEHLAYVVYASVSKEHPSGVMVTHRSLLNLIDSEQDTSIAGRDSAVHIFGSFSDPSAWEVWNCLAQGATLYLPSDNLSTLPSRIANELVEQGVTRLSGPPPFVEQLLDKLLERASDRLTIHATGGKLRRTPPENFVGSVFNHFGVQECTAVATRGQVSFGTKSVTVGRPIANMRVFVLNEYLRPVGIGEVGELWISGIGLARGYINDPTLTSQRFRPDPFTNTPGSRMCRTRVVGRWLSGGQIEYISPLREHSDLSESADASRDLEDAIFRHPDVSTAIVRNKSDSKQNSLEAYYSARSSELTPAALKEFLGRCLPESAIPEFLVLVDEVPLTPQGTVDVEALERLKESPPADRGEDRPTAAERVISALMAEVLEVDHVGIRDNFFAMGGHSLLGMQLTANISSVFRVEFPVANLFATPTTEAIVAALTDAVGDSGTVEEIAQAWLDLDSEPIVTEPDSPSFPYLRAKA